MKKKLSDQSSRTAEHLRNFLLPQLANLNTREHIGNLLERVEVAFSEDDKPLLTKRMKKQGIRISQAILPMEQAAEKLSTFSLYDEYLWIILVKKKVAFVIFLMHFLKSGPIIMISL
jgi:hypothetical protein